MLTYGARRKSGSFFIASFCGFFFVHCIYTDMDFCYNNYS